MIRHFLRAPAVRWPCFGGTVALFVWLILLSSATAQEYPQPAFAPAGLDFLKKHCLQCHGDQKMEGSLTLAAMTDNAAVIRGRKVWQAVLKRVEAGDMPPEDRPRPSQEEIAALGQLIRGLYDHHDRHAAPDPGRVTVRRLNRVEYNRTVRDLTGVDFNPAEDFPSDDVGHGFDNIGDVLTLPPVLMERYLAAAESVAERAILTEIPKPSRRYLSGRYLQPAPNDKYAEAKSRFRPLRPAEEDPVLSGPLAAPADYLKFSAEDELILRAKLYATPQGTAPVKVALFISGANLVDPSPDAEVDQLLGANLKNIRPLRILQVFEITARDEKSPQEIEFLISKRGDIQRAGVAVVKGPEGEPPPHLHIEHIWSEGPLETRPPSHLMLLKCSPDKPQAEQTREVLQRFLTRAFRRTATAEEVERYSGLVDSAVAAGEKWEAGLRVALQAALVSPKFLFRLELDDRPTAAEHRALDQFQLAARLSYFLWSSMPDDTLLDLAARGELIPQLEAQVRRMLSDPKATALVDNFALQWLQLQRLKIVAPDAKLFPNFNDPLREAMLQETRLFVGEVFQQDRSILDLLDADFTYLNEPLARHYGIADTQGNWMGQPVERPNGQPIRGPEFVRVALAGGQRGGLPTQASVLTVTSNPTRTSPVKRGRWILEQLLGDPPPAPPPNVPELVEDEQAALSGSLRQRMEQHRAKASCANCHARMDPIGFAFENYDAVGAFRLKDGEFPVETAGELPDGSKFAGPTEFKQLLRQRQGAFARCLIEKLLTYALGRGLEYYDRPVIDRLQSAVAAADYKFSAVILQIVSSEPFRLRRGLEETAANDAER